MTKKDFIKLGLIGSSIGALLGSRSLFQQAARKAAQGDRQGSDLSAFGGLILLPLSISPILIATGSKL